MGGWYFGVNGTIYLSYHQIFHGLGFSRIFAPCLTILPVCVFPYDFQCSSIDIFTWSAVARATSLSFRRVPLNYAQECEICRVIVCRWLFIMQIWTSCKYGGCGHDKDLFQRQRWGQGRRVTYAILNACLRRTFLWLPCHPLADKLSFQGIRTKSREFLCLLLLLEMLENMAPLPLHTYSLFF